MPRERGGGGQYVETVALEDVLAVFDDVDGPPVVTSADVAETTGLSRDSARRKLNTLEDRGDVASRKTAGRVLYWPTDCQRTQTAADDRETPPEDPVGDTDGDEPDRREGAHTPREEAGIGNGIKDAVARVAEGWDDAPDRLEARKAAAAAVLEHAVATGEPVSKSSEVTEAAHGEHPVAGQSHETWWRKNVRPVLSEVGNYDHGAHGYRVDDLE